jgi:hypothetical protein
VIGIAFENMFTARSTGCPAGLAMLMVLIHVVQKWKTSTTYQSQIYESIGLHLARLIKSGVSPSLPNLAKIVTAVAFPHDGKIHGSCAFYFFVFFIFVFHSLTRLQHIPVNRFSRTIPQKMQTDKRKSPLSKCYSIFSLSGGHLPPKPPKFRRQYGNPSQNENVK